MTPAEREIARIRSEYERREREIGRDFYALTRPANLFTRHHQERALVGALARSQLLPLASRRILEVGCGRGQWLGVLESLGARREQLAGIDLDASRISEAAARFPGADVQAGDATQLPWDDRRFDIVLQFTVFSSILDAHMQRTVATEMRRVLAPGGVLLWYDLRYDNPANPHVRGIGHRTIRALFPGATIDYERVTLATPLVRRIVPRFWLLAEALERMRLLNTHYLAVIRFAAPG